LLSVSLLLSSLLTIAFGVPLLCLVGRPTLEAFDVPMSPLLLVFLSSNVPALTSCLI
jgi:hypothetical protein